MSGPPRLASAEAFLDAYHSYAGHPRRRQEVCVALGITSRTYDRYRRLAEDAGLLQAAVREVRTAHPLARKVVLAPGRWMVDVPDTKHQRATVRRVG